MRRLPSSSRMGASQFPRMAIFTASFLTSCVRICGCDDRLLSSPSPELRRMRPAAFLASTLPPAFHFSDEVSGSRTRATTSSVMHQRKKVALAPPLGARGLRGPVPLCVSVGDGQGMSPTAAREMITWQQAEEGLDGGVPFPEFLAEFVDRLPEDLLEIISTIEGEGNGAVWLVGGCVRDCLAGLQPWEVDMASTLLPERLLELFPRSIDTGSQFGTVTVRKGGVAVEVTTLRADGDYSDGRRPEAVTFGKSLKEDLLRRDFTINAMAVHVGRRRLYDPYGGQPDIEKGVLRAVGNAESRLREDGLRAMRAYRSRVYITACIYQSVVNIIF